MIIIQLVLPLTFDKIFNDVEVLSVQSASEKSIPSQSDWGPTDSRRTRCMHVGVNCVNANWGLASYRGRLANRKASG